MVMDGMPPHVFFLGYHGKIKMSKCMNLDVFMTSIFYMDNIITWRYVVEFW